MTGPTEESALATVADWPEGLAAVLRGAADQARAAVVEFSGPEAVGDYLGVSYEDGNAATHRFIAHLPGYQGWQWAVVVASYSGADHATISEVVLVPGPTALLAPDWVPWEQRVRPGDLSPGDLLAPAKDDPRLVPGYTASGDAQVDETAAEIGLGRRWVMSAWGRAQSAQRWHDGDYGPALLWRGRRNASAATAVSSCRWPGRWAQCSGYVVTNCPLTGMLSIGNTAVAPIPTPLRRPVAAHPFMSRTTTVCSTSSRSRLNHRFSLTRCSLLFFGGGTSRRNPTDYHPY